jgi:hypothetical protein
MDERRPRTGAGGGAGEPPARKSGASRRKGRRQWGGLTSTQAVSGGRMGGAAGLGRGGTKDEATIVDLIGRPQDEGHAPPA